MSLYHIDEKCPYTSEEVYRELPPTPEKRALDCCKQLIIRFLIKFRQVFSAFRDSRNSTLCAAIRNHSIFYFFRVSCEWFCNAPSQAVHRPTAALIQQVGEQRVWGGGLEFDSAYAQQPHETAAR
jgi:hypothetical protein